MTQVSAAAWTYGILAVLTIVDALAHIAYLAELTAALILLYLVLEFRNIPRAQQIAGVTLAVLGTIGAAVGGDVTAVFTDGVAQARTFLVLFFAVVWLQPAVGESPALRATRETIVSQPPGRRYLYLASGVHFIGAVLNIAGLGLLTTIVDKNSPADATLRRRLSLALMQGFTAASCWSPFYIGTIVVLVAVPGLVWTDVAAYGAIMAVVLIGGNWARDRWLRHRARGTATARERVPLSHRNALRAAAILAALIAVVMVLVEALGTSIPVTLGIVGPFFGLLWYASIAQAREAPAGSTARLARRIVASFPTLRNEALVFVAANILGVGVAAAIPAENIGSAFQAAVPWADGRIAVLVALFLACGAMGLHPVIVVLSLSALLPPEAVDLPNLIVALTYMGCWGMSTMVSPFSGTTLFMSRVTGVPAHVIGWRWSPAVAAASGVLVAGYVITLRHLLF